MNNERTFRYYEIKVTTKEKTYIAEIVTRRRRSTAYISRLIYDVYGKHALVEILGVKFSDESDEWEE